MRFTAGGLLFCLAVLGTSVHAQEGSQGGYLGVSIGNTSAEIEGESESDMSFRIGGGTRINPNFALEAWYVDFGKPEQSGSGDPILGSWSLSAETTAFLFQLVGIVPVQKDLEFFAKFGLAMWDADLCATSSLLGSGCMSEDGTDMMLGLGLNYVFGPTASLRLEYEMGTFELSDLGVDVDMSTLMLGVNIRF